MNISQAIVRSLEQNGVEYAFGGSGAGVADLVFALDESKSIKTIITRHEQGASFMACGYAMFSDKLGVCFATPGPGAFNLISGLSVALSDSLPVLAISGYETSEGVGKGGLGETTGLNRTPDSQTVFAAITKKSFLIQKASQTCDILEEALNIAFEGRPGPVHIHLPFDISRAEVPNYRDIEVEVKPVLPLPKQVTEFAAMLERALAEKKKIVALLGYGCIRSHAEGELLAFVEKFQIPFMTTMDAKGILPENHPLSLGMTGASGDPGARQALFEADVVLAIGNSFSKWQTWRWAQGLYDDKMLLQINIDKAAINRVYPADLALISDVKPAIVGITQALEKRVKSVETASPVIEKYFDGPIQYSGDKIHPAELVRKISAFLPENSIMLGDAGNHMIWLAAYTQLNQGQNYQNPGIFGPMASNVSAAIGAQCANPHRRVIVGCGDMGYQMAGFELMTALQYQIPVIWIIFNNGEYNVIKMMHQKNYGKEVFNKFLNPNFADYARVCGALSYRIEKLSDFEAAFQEALAANQPALLDVVVEPDVFPPFGLIDGSLRKQVVPGQ
jgi:acetolactate synthase-1/2/3 large subunit